MSERKATHQRESRDNDDVPPEFEEHIVGPRGAHLYNSLTIATGQGSVARNVVGDHPRMKIFIVPSERRIAIRPGSSGCQLRRPKSTQSPLYTTYGLAKKFCLKYRVKVPLEFDPKLNVWVGTVPETPERESDHA
jgi:hypothetical protein